jgi:hypothetical protein
VTVDRFIPLSATFFEEEETRAIGMQAAATYLAMACKIRMLGSDGWITESQVQSLGIRTWRQDVAKMLTVGYLTAHVSALGNACWYMPSYLKHNQSQQAYEMASA